MSFIVEEKEKSSGVFYATHYLLTQITFSMAAFETTVCIKYSVCIAKVVKSDPTMVNSFFLPMSSLNP